MDGSLYFALAVFVLIVLRFLYKIPVVRGKLGENSMARQLKWLNSNEYTVLNDLRIQHKNGHTSQIDHVVVSVYGIFVIETKNYKGRISGKVSDQEWTQTFNRKSKFTFYNPLLQNDIHVQTIERLIMKHKALPIISIVAFNNEATIAVRTKKHVIHTSDVLDTIKSYCIQYISQNEIQSVVSDIQLKISTSKKFMKVHKLNIYRAQNNKHFTHSLKRCPNCKSRLVKRSSTNGNFYGCSRYPKCTYARNSV